MTFIFSVADLQSHCKISVNVDICNSSKHTSALHPESQMFLPVKAYKGERSIQEVNVTNECTKICNIRETTLKSCVKIILVRLYPQRRKTLSSKFV